MELISGYLNDPALRQSFNRLAIETFSLDFEPWYQGGMLPHGRYIPHSLVQDGEVIANCSANLFDLIVEGREVPAVQLGTVMTAKEHRGRGRIIRTGSSSTSSPTTRCWASTRSSVFAVFPRPPISST